MACLYAEDGSGNALARAATAFPDAPWVDRLPFQGSDRHMGGKGSGERGQILLGYDWDVGVLGLGKDRIKEH